MLIKLLILSTVALPLLGFFMILLTPRANADAIRRVAAIATGLVFVAAVLLWLNFNPRVVQEGFQTTTNTTLDPIYFHPDYSFSLSWIPQLNVNFAMGIDGLAVAMLLLSGIVSFLAVFSSYKIEDRTKEYFAYFLILVACMNGVFVATDMFLFYVFWEAMLVPMYFLIGIWGGPRREYAAIKFFLYTLFGGVFMLLGFLALVFYAQKVNHGALSFMFNDLARATRNPEFPIVLQYAVFIGLFVGFAVKVPIFPFHTWLPDAHVEAPTPISVILAGVLLKCGTYAFVRILYPICPRAAIDFAPVVAFLGFTNIVYGALVCLAQTDLKKLIAYSSVSHMGFCILGLAALSPAGVNGSIFQMVSHGLSSAALFMLVGVIYDRAHTREINGFGGIAKTMPYYTGVFTLATFASLGLPGLVGFIGEFMVFYGAFFPGLNALQSQEYIFAVRLLAFLSTAGIVFTAAYFLWMVQRVFLGAENPRWQGLPDMNSWEGMTLAPLCVLMVVFGLHPSPLLHIFESFTQQFLTLF